MNHLLLCHRHLTPSSVLAAFVLLSATAYAETTTRSPSQDTYLTKAASGTAHGSSTVLVLGQEAGCPTSGCDAAILLQYDLSSIPANASVSAATLRFTRIGTNHSGGFRVDIAKHGKTWSEGSATWSSEQVGSDSVYATETLDASSASPTLSGSGLRQLVAEWVADPGSNRGLALIADGSPLTYVSFASKEDGGLQPIRLEVTYSTEPLRVTVDANDAEAVEPSNPGKFRIYRSIVSSSPLDVAFSMSGSEATPGSDFTMSSYTAATIPANQDHVDLTVNVVDDSAPEDDESIQLRIQSGTGYQVGSPSTATINLRDNDGGGSDIEPFVCSANSTQHCLGNGRFRIRVTWRDYNGNTGNGTAVALTGDSGLFWFFDSTNLEFLVKILDGCGFNQRYWVYAAATTDVQYTLEVADSRTGKVKKYYNPLGTRSPAITDASAFATCDALTATDDPEFTRLPLSTLINDRDLDIGAATDLESASGLCVPGTRTLCLNQSRFKVEVSWRDYQGTTGTGTARTFSSDSGLFWFFSSNNFEFLVKVLDGCSFNSRYWVYAAATTDVAYTLTVTDMQNGRIKTYSNALGTRAPAITDANAFDTCSGGGDPPVWYDGYDFGARGVIAFWPLDGDALDRSGNGNHGTWAGSAAYTSGRFRQAHSLQPASYMQVARPPQLSTFDAVTLSAWFKTTTIAENESLIGIGIDGAGPQHAYLFVLSGGVTFNGQSSAGAIGTPNVATSAVHDGAWHLLTATWGGAVSRVYVDGAMISEASGTGGTVSPAAGQQLYLNRHDYSGSYSSRLTGTVDDVVVFGRALTPGEVALLAQDSDGNGIADFW